MTWSDWAMVKSLWVNWSRLRNYHKRLKKWQNSRARRIWHHPIRYYENCCCCNFTCNDFRIWRSEGTRLRNQPSKGTRPFRSMEEIMRVLFPAPSELTLSMRGRVLRKKNNGLVLFIKDKKAPKPEGIPSEVLPLVINSVRSTHVVSGWFSVPLKGCEASVDIHRQRWFRGTARVPSSQYIGCWWTQRGATSP